VATLTVISWRDIPSQVIAREGRQTAKAMLGLRFQVAVDRAATRAGRKDMDTYLAEWRRTVHPCGTDLDAEVAAEVARIEGQYTKARLDGLTTALGFAGEDQERPDSSPAHHTTEEP
jgi:Virulence factor